ncbi:hypothetical protein Glove_499g33 [Diversispora epigaea]|uniref:Zinc-ribbon domain-containing protein n=1 Tax=Diversispora epigaea TaxID=1348612 RepID=A0A397GHF6_9GLOM|nr:hypothetical protein Glove_499g33 [Diversispora epigaea]
MNFNPVDLKSRLPLLWRCDKGHEWIANLMKIKNHGSWCPGHEWYARLSNIKSGRWCPHCAGVILHTLEIAKQIAHSRNRKCLSIEYKNLETDLLWSFAKQIAFNQNGEYLSKKYINTRLKLLWKCANGHLWNASLWSIKIIVYSYCFKYKREQLCREIVTKYFDPPSENRRPNFLKTPKHSLGLKLDIYYPNYGFAIEVQGQQHEKYVKFFHSGDPNNLIKQQAQDQLKKELCKENWIVLKYV